MTPWTAAHQASLSITNSWSLPKLMPIESVMPSSLLILCCPLLLLSSIFPSIRVFSNESALHIRWPVPTISSPMDCSPPGSSVYGILQPRLLEWVAILGYRPDPGIKPGSSALRSDSLPSEPPGKQSKRSILMKFPTVNFC